MFFLRALADNRNPNSLANQMRRNRFAFFRRLLSSIPRPYRILDVGGTQDFWVQMGFHDEEGVTIVVANIEASHLELSQPGGATKFQSLVADGRNLSCFEDGAFDVVFSNSVIEHVGALEGQRCMMKEIARVGKRYWVQTPNYWFPLEPHFHFLGFQFLPRQAQAWLLTKMSLGWTERQSQFRSAHQIVSSVRLLSKRELREMVPGAEIYNERFLGLNKSFALFKGWTAPVPSCK